MCFKAKKSHYVKQKQYCKKFVKDFKNGPRLKKKSQKGVSDSLDVQVKNYVKKILKLIKIIALDISSNITSASSEVVLTS